MLRILTRANTGQPCHNTNSMPGNFFILSDLTLDYASSAQQRAISFQENIDYLLPIIMQLKAFSKSSIRKKS